MRVIETFFDVTLLSVEPIDGGVRLSTTFYDRAAGAPFRLTLAQTAELIPLLPEPVGVTVQRDLTRRRPRIQYPPVHTASGVGLQVRECGEPTKHPTVWVCQTVGGEEIIEGERYVHAVDLVARDAAQLRANLEDWLSDAVRRVAVA